MNNYSKLKLNLSTTNDGIYDYTISNNEVTIIKYLGTASNIIIPETIEDCPVTTIGSSSFINNLLLQSIFLSSVTHIQSKAFANCPSLTIVSGDKVSIIDSYCFYNCEKLKDLKISTAQYLQKYAFANCISLECIHLPLALELPPFIFSKCYGLKSVNFPMVKSIGAFAFESCNSIETINISEASYIDYGAFCYSNIQNADFPKVIEVNYDAFLNCSFLEKVNLPSVTSIGNYAFQDSGTTCLCLSKDLLEVGIDILNNTSLKGLTIDYGIEDISLVSEDDWYSFANKLPGLNVESIMGRYIKNNLYYANFSLNDKEPPIITLNGENPMTLEVGLSTYVEPGVTVTDNCCEVFNTLISGSVDTNKIGKYTITYTATDISDNQSEITRTINVIDTTPPVITLVGDSTVTVIVNTNYEEQGADITDNSGENLVPILNGFVDDQMVGQYKVTYNAVDSSNNHASPVVRTVNVVEDNNIRCSQIVAYNNRGVITKWALYTLEDELLYESGNYLVDEQFILNLDSLALESGTVFYLKAVVEGSDERSTVNLRYIPSSYTTYFILQLTVIDDTTTGELHYSGVAYSDGTPPLVNSTQVRCDNESLVLNWWEVLTLDDELIYKSDYMIQPDNPITIDFKNLNIEVGTILKVKAKVSLGDDSLAYLHFLYMPENAVQATLVVIGSTFKTCVMVKAI